ncbi:MAG TPA: hypothetical protein VGK17_17830 [Propionicimonas sp.]
MELFLTSSARLLLRLAGFAGLDVLFAGICRFLPVLRISLRRAFV